MLKRNFRSLAATLLPQKGVTLLEVLITMVLISFGLLGLAGLQAKTTQAQLESFQRAQALTLLADITQRMQANPAHVADYVSVTPLGTNDGLDCVTQSTLDKVDRCEWSLALKGSLEQKSSLSVGAPIDARGCIELVQALDQAICRPAIYRASVAWQGLMTTVVPTVSCGAGSYGPDEGKRRVVSLQVVAPLLGC